MPTNQEKLFKACGDGDCSEARRLLLLDDVSVDGQDQWGHTALWWACSGTPDKYIHQMSYPDIIQLLFEHGATSVNDAGEQDDFTPLMSAIKSGNKASVALLLEHGANVNDVKRVGDGDHVYTALDIACMAFGDDICEIINLLFSYGATGDVNRSRGDGCSPFFVVCAHPRSSETIVERFLDRGADVHYVDRQGNSSLHAASCGGNKEVVNLLLNLGVDVNLENNDGQTALQMARDEGQEEVVELLLARSALDEERPRMGMGR